MTHLHPYLNFNGRCREAMTFYQQCLGGELSMQTISDSPVADQMPTEMASSILHSQLVTDGFILMASDMGGAQLKEGNSVSLMLSFSSEAELHQCFQKLSEQGEVVMPPAIQFWGALFGHLVDKFGTQWLLGYDPKTPS